LVPEAYLYRLTQVVHQGRRVGTHALAFPQRLSDVSMLSDRRDAFHAALIAHLKASHDVFLKSIKVSLPSEAKLRCWHPKFDLEATPDVPMCDLDTEKSNGDLVDKIAPATPSQILDAILESKSEAKAKGPTVKTYQSEKLDEMSTVLSTPSPKGPPKKLSLLERIKAKEREAETKHMTASSSDTAAASELSVLSEFAENLAFLFSSAGKGALPLGDVTTKLTLGTNKAPLSPKDVAGRLYRLADILPTWLQLVPTGRAVIVRLDRQQSLKAVQISLAESFKNST